MILAKFSVILQKYNGDSMLWGEKALNFEYISSKDNKLLKSVRKLISSTRERKEQQRFVLEGLRLCADAAQNGYTIEAVIVSEELEGSDRLDVIVAAAKQRIKVPNSLFTTLCDTVSPQGVLCIVKTPERKSVEMIEEGKYIVLENTADPANLGAIARTAEALGISGLIVSANGCDPFSPKSQRAGMGALLRIPVIVCEDLLSDLVSLKKKGFEIFASVVSDADTLVTEADFSGNCAVLVGNEANGLTEAAIGLSDTKVTIPMAGRAESLNAAAAASILMWEMTRNGAKL